MNGLDDQKIYFIKKTERHKLCLCLLLKKERSIYSTEYPFDLRQDA
jgi:hypothetical protein